MTSAKFTRRFREASDEAPKEPDKERAIVVVIDDDPRMRSALEFTLRRDYDVRLYASAQEGIAAMTEMVSLVILDIRMPGIDGLTAYLKIKALFPKVPIIFYTAFQDILEKQDLLSTHKAFGYFDKNGDVSGLIAAVEKAVQHHSLVSSMASAQKLVRGIMPPDAS
ncbi:response regulator [Sorangium sp. So ce363]|uniref:response regulator n=1 Tax=Sorangium sp. So ce363 TaxID=3133304 RepID=UPI003F628F68